MTSTNNEIAFNHFGYFILIFVSFVSVVVVVVAGDMLCVLFDVARRAHNVRSFSVLRALLLFNGGSGKTHTHTIDVELQNENRRKKHEKKIIIFEKIICLSIDEMGALHTHTHSPAKGRKKK